MGGSLSSNCNWWHKTLQTCSLTETLFTVALSFLWVWSHLKVTTLESSFSAVTHKLLLRSLQFGTLIKCISFPLSPFVLFLLSRLGEIQGRASVRIAAPPPTAPSNLCPLWLFHCKSCLKRITLLLRSLPGSVFYASCSVHKFTAACCQASQAISKQLHYVT